MNSYLFMALVRKSMAGLISAAGLVLLLTACGGGSDSATSPAQGVVPGSAASTPAPAPPDVVAAYPVGSEELFVYNLLNAERNRCGFGLLAANTQLDAAARAHADYQLINSRNSHLEDARVPEGFTGIDPETRIRAQGYANVGGVTDEYAFFTSTSPIRSVRGLGEIAIRSLLNAPYHLNGLMTGFRDVGIAVRSTADTGRGANGAFVQINPAYKASAGLQMLAATDVKTYPCDGATGISRLLSNESPNPVPGRDLNANPLGSTVYIAVREGNRLAITTASITDGVTGQNVILRIPVTSANDPYGPCATGCFKAHQAYIAADSPLQPENPYVVRITGTNNGAVFSRTFTFVTGG